MQINPRLTSFIIESQDSDFVLTFFFPYYFAVKVLVVCAYPAFRLHLDHSDNGECIVNLFLTFH